MTLPTGAGKTRTAVEGLLRWRIARSHRPGILWIAQSEELCEQAVQAFREVWTDQGHRDAAIRESLTIHRLWGSHNDIPAVPGVVVASIQKLHSLCRETHQSRLFNETQLMAERLGVVVVDEAHRMTAPSYTEVLHFLGIDVQERASKMPLVGLTATPFRRDAEETRRLANRFQGRLLAPTDLGEDPVSTLRARGVLSWPTHHVIRHNGKVVSVEANSKYKIYYEIFKDFHPELLKEIGQQRSRNAAILSTLCDLPADWPTLLFACSVEHAMAMAALLRRRGRTAATITSDTRPATRRFVIEEFRAGRLSVLCNYGVLTTGFDAPAIRAVVVARPTASPVLYEQMIGRGMRGPAFGGTRECLVIDLEDNIQFGGQMAFRRYEEYWKKDETHSRAGHRAVSTG